MLKILSYCVLAISLGWSLICFAQCPPQAFNREALLTLRQNEFTIEQEDRRQQLAIDLLSCLKSSDPVLRDQVAFEAYATWMRGKALTVETVNTISSTLLAWLPGDVPDPEGFAKPFAVLVLAEIARMDRIEPFMSDQQRQRMVDAVTTYLSSIRDYRGFDGDAGWRHGVAHSADLILQLSLNPNINTPQLQAMANAIATQIVPQERHFYIYGESQRLARAVFYLAQRESIEASWWQTWFTGLISTVDRGEQFQSQTGLSRRHNLLNFFTMFYLYVAENGEPEMQALFLILVRSSVAELG